MKRIGQMDVLAIERELDRRIHEEKQSQLDEMQYGQAAQVTQRHTLDSILTEHELRCAAIHEPDVLDKTIAGISFITACILCVVVVLFG